MVTVSNQTASLLLTNSNGSDNPETAAPDRSVVAFANSRETLFPFLPFCRPFAVLPFYRWKKRR